MAKPREKAAAKAAEAAAQNGAGPVEETANTVNNIDARKVSFGLGNLGQGFLAAAVCVYSGALAYNKFRQVMGQSYVSSE